MTRSSPRQAVIMTSVALGALCAGAGVANAGDGFTQNNLISNIHARGVSPGHAVQRILDLAASMMKAHRSGCQLREELPLNSR